MTTRVLSFKHSDLFTDGSDIPDAAYDHFEYRIDGGAAVALALPFDPDHEYEASFDDAGLSLGSHSIEVRLILAGDRATNWVSGSFSVEDKRVPSDPFDVTVS